MRVYVTSTPEELKSHQAAACEVTRALGLEPVLRDQTAGRGLDPVTACARRVASVDLLLAIVGWRRGQTPPPEFGGDGLRPWTFWEVKSAFDHGRPVAVLMAGEGWCPEIREDNPKIQAVMRDLRGELTQLATFFDEETTDNLRSFRELVRRQLVEVRRGLRESNKAIAASQRSAGAQLRQWPPPKLPERPYPVLLPYTHPSLMAGRERELEEVRQQLRLPVPILGLYGLSGIGKSSLLAGGLVPGLRAEGYPVAFDRHPSETGIADRLLGDLLETEELTAVGEDPAAFVDRLLVVRRMASGQSPLLVLDQFEDLLRRTASARRVRAVVGTLLAASAQRQPGLDGPPCRWLLAYRQEFHGEVFHWLGDVLSDARTEGLEGVATLPHNFSEPERFAVFPLYPLGTPPPGASDLEASAATIFRAAIEKPLELVMPNGRPRYPWRFAAGHAERLARAFGEARATRPEAPLAPELQVVLAHLLAQAERSDSEGSNLEPTHSEESDDHKALPVRVPEEPGELIEQALEDHLCQALDFVFPLETSRGSLGKLRAFGPRATDTRIARTRALLALRELADLHGHRGQGLTAELLAGAIGPEGQSQSRRTAEGRRILEKLARPQARLVMLEQREKDWVYVLSHDRMAEVVIRLTDNGGRYSGLGVDSELLRLRRFVVLRSELFEAGEVEQATAISSRYFRRIKKYAAALLWEEKRKRWWAACQKRRKVDHRRALISQGAAAAVVSLVILGTWNWADLRTQRRALLDEVAAGEPETAFAALAKLTKRPDIDSERLLEVLRQRKHPLDVLERGVEGVSKDERGSAVLRVATLSLPLVEENPYDPILIASMVWAIDAFVARETTLARLAIELRGKALEPLRRSQPPPPYPSPKDPNWANIPAGSFWMGKVPRERGGRGQEGTISEQIEPQVMISEFRLMTHEVTNSEYRRLVPEHRSWRLRQHADPPEVVDDLPAENMTWYEAYTYSAWLGGRLPTEAEWEYAARADCAYSYCKRDGSEATLHEVAWRIGNATDPETLEPTTKLIMQLEPNPWGLYDIYGNVSEFTADWQGEHSEENLIDPVGPGNNSWENRIFRGGSFLTNAEWVTVTTRVSVQARATTRDIGFRVALHLEE